MTTTEPEHRFACNQCDFTTPSAVVLRNHELVHSYTKTCPHCPKKFFQDSHLKFHLLKCGNSNPNQKIILKKQKVSKPVETIRPVPIEVLKESPKRKKMKLEEEFLLEDAEEIQNVLSTNYDYDSQTSTQEELEPLIESVCCELEFQDLLSLLLHIHEVHPTTFSATMSAMQPIIEGNLLQNKTENGDDVVFVQFQTTEENVYE